MTTRTSSAILFIEREVDNMLRDYLFVSLETGEEFFVETDEGSAKAKEIAIANFGEDVRLLGSYLPEQADILGYDTY